MFERFTEPARRIVFFARYEASTLASPFLEPEHLLLGIIREAKHMPLDRQFTPEIMAQVKEDVKRWSRAKHPGSPSPAIVDLPISRDAQSVLSIAAEEAQALSDRSIRPEHLLLALLRLENSDVPSILRRHGVVYEAVRAQVATGVSRLDPVAPQAPSLENAAARLRTVLSSAAQDLPGIGETIAAAPVREGGWSPKQIVGHLIDSVSNNHQRIVRALIQPDLDFPNYEQEAWNNAQHYHAADWDSLVRLWVAYNQHLLWLVLHVPEEKLATSCRIGGKPAITLREIITGYIDHLERHLNQIPRPAGQAAARGV